MDIKHSNGGNRHVDDIGFTWGAVAYAYDTFDRVSTIDYSDATPDVAYTYDRLGRQLTITDVLGTRTNIYSPTDLLEERHPDGTALVRSYDAFGRPSGIAIAPDYAVTYAYDAFGSEISLQCSDLGIHPFHFSTKSQEKGIGLSYYGYRFYKLDFGRWMNRDPIGERGEFHWAFRQDDVSRGLSTLSGNNVASWMKEEYEDTKNPYHFVWNNPVTKWDYLGLKSGFFRRGRCCNISSHDEWALVAVGTNCPAWRKLAPGQCVGGKIGNLDCEGMTCGGGFYMVSGRLLGGGHCVTPGYDHGPFKKLRWTPTQKDCDAKAPSHRTHCKGLSDTPPDYKYTPRPCASRM